MKETKLKRHPYFGIPEHKVSISKEDFINGKMPNTIKRANKLGHIVTLNVRRLTSRAEKK